MSETTRKITTRRAMMGNAGMAALAGMAAAVAMPAAQAVQVLPTPHGADAELIAIGQEAAALIKQRKPLAARWWAVSVPHAYGDWTSSQKAELHAIADALEPIDERMEQLVDRALELPATTREGMIVKARLIRHDMSLCHSSDGVMDLGSMDPGSRLALALTEDLLGAVAA